MATPAVTFTSSPVTAAEPSEARNAQAAARGITEEAARAEMTGLSPLRRLVRAEEVAEACVFLASDGSAAVTGEDLNVAAGVVMY